MLDLKVSRAYDLDGTIVLEDEELSFNLDVAFGELWVNVTTVNENGERGKDLLLKCLSPSEVIELKYLVDAAINHPAK